MWWKPQTKYRYLDLRREKMQRNAFIPSQAYEACTIISRWKWIYRSWNASQRQKERGTILFQAELIRGLSMHSLGHHRCSSNLWWKSIFRLLSALEMKIFAQTGGQSLLKIDLERCLLRILDDVIGMQEGLLKRNEELKGIDIDTPFQD